MTTSPVICFGQQPCGFFPKRFLAAKILTARRLQTEIGGEIVFFYHDSDHDPRETKTTLRHRTTSEPAQLNFAIENKVQRKFSPLYLKHIAPDWHGKTVLQLPNYVGHSLINLFKKASAPVVADFCLEMYRQMGLLEGIRVMRSSDRALRQAACDISEFFVDVPHEGETVRARMREGALELHEGGNSFVTLPAVPFTKEQISPSRDSRLRWMQSIVRCTHYIAGAGEQAYLRPDEAPEITFIQRDTIERSDEASPNSPVEPALLLAFGAHPDDIEFGCGGVIARETRSGREAHFVICSRGEAASHGSPKERIVESRKAAALLGATVEFIELDGDARLEVRAVHAIKLAGVLRKLRPGIVLAPTLVENQHPDHARLGRLVRDAARLARYGGLKELRKLPSHAISQLLYYAVTPEAEPKDVTPVLIDISAPEIVAAWTAAMEAHASQTSARNYVELQVTRARLLGVRAGVGHAMALFPNDPLVLDSLAQVNRGARRF